MTTLREAAQQALEQLKINRTNFRKGPSKSICKMLAGGNDEAIADLEAALAEPVEWLTGCPECGMDGGCDCPSGTYNPPQRKPLTEEEIVEAVREADIDWQAGWTLDEHEPNRFATLARAIERAHGIGDSDD